MRGEVFDVTNAFDALDGVHQVDVAIVAQENRVIRAFRRGQRNDHENVRARAVDHDAFLFNRIGKLSFRLSNTVLRIDLHDVDIGADVEQHVEGQLAIIGIIRLQVQQLIDSVNFGLNRGSD